MEYREEGKGICMFLETFNKHIMQPLTIADPNKGFLVPKAKPFFSSSEKRLDCIAEIGDWVQHSQHPHAENTINENNTETELQNDADEEKEVSHMKAYLNICVIDIWIRQNHIWNNQCEIFIWFRWWKKTKF